MLKIQVETTSNIFCSVKLVPEVYASINFQIVNKQQQLSLFGRSGLQLINIDLR